MFHTLLVRLHGGLPFPYPRPWPKESCFDVHDGPSLMMAICFCDRGVVGAIERAALCKSIGPPITER